MRILLALFVSLLLSACGKAKFTAQNATEMYRHVAPAVVQVIIPEMGTGSGFYTTDMLGRKVIVTNAHVCIKPRQRLIIAPSNGGRKFAVYPKYISYAKDLCVIMAPKNDKHPTLPLSSSEISPGDALFTVGHPYGNPLTVSPGTAVGKQAIEIGYDESFCANGHGTIVPGFFGAVCVRKMQSTIMDVHMGPGSSGGAVVNIHGEVIGVAFAGGQTGNFAIYLKDLVRVLSQVK